LNTTAAIAAKPPKMTVVAPIMPGGGMDFSAQVGIPFTGRKKHMSGTNSGPFACVMGCGGSGGDVNQGL
jgi:hypothetical protein